MGDELRWGRYARVSRKEQAGPDTTSIENQLKDEAALIAREGGVLVDDYVDDDRYLDANGRKVDPSGERADRPEFQRLLADVRSGRINAIAAWHEWRLYRDYPPFTDFIMMARKYKPVVKLVNGLWLEQFAVFGAWQGKADNDHRRLQLGKGVWGKAGQGYSPTSIPRFYATTRNDKGKRNGVIFREQYREWLDAVADIFLQGTPYLAMVSLIPPDPFLKRRISKHSLITLFHNSFMLGEVLAGKRSVNGPRDLIKGVQPPAWDPVTVAAIRIEVARRDAAGHSVGYTHHGPDEVAFRGLLRCAYPGCQSMLTANLGGKNRKRWPNYACHHSYLIRRGDRHGVIHPSNGLSERALRLALRAMGDGLTREKAVEIARRVSVPAPMTNAAAETRLAQLRVELAEVEAELASLPASAKRSRAEREADAAKLHSKIEALEDATRLPMAPAEPPEHLVDVVLAFYANDDFLTRPAGDLHEQVRNIWGTLYVWDKQVYLEPLV